MNIFVQLQTTKIIIFSVRGTGLFTHERCLHIGFVRRTPALTHEGSQYIDPSYHLGKDFRTSRFLSHCTCVSFVPFRAITGQVIPARLPDRSKPMEYFM